MKKSLFLILTVVFFSACKKSHQEPAVICAQSQALQTEDERLPQLDLNPDFIRYENYFHPNVSDQSVAFMIFEAYRNSSDVQVKLEVARNGMGAATRFQCNKTISISDFNSFVQLMNSSDVCKSSVLSTISCSQSVSAMLPQVLQAQENGQKQSVALFKYSYNSDQYFCDKNAALDFQALIISIYAAVDLNNDCTIIN